jgi:hypothetical protein
MKYTTKTTTEHVLRNSEQKNKKLKPNGNGEHRKVHRKEGRKKV